VISFVRQCGVRALRTRDETSALASVDICAGRVGDVSVEEGREFEYCRRFNGRDSRISEATPGSLPLVVGGDISD